MHMDTCTSYLEGAYDITVIATGNGISNTSFHTICILYYTNILWKGMKPTILPLWVNSRTDWFL